MERKSYPPPGRGVYAIRRWWISVENRFLFVVRNYDLNAGASHSRPAESPAGARVAMATVPRSVSQSQRRQF